MRVVPLNQRKWSLGWSRGVIHISTKVIQVSKNATSSKEYWFAINKGQYSVVRSERTVLKNLTFPNIWHFERDAVCQWYCILCRNIVFSKRDTAPLRKSLDMWKCIYCAPSKGMAYLFQKHFRFCMDIYCSFKNTLNCSKGRLHLWKRVCCMSVLNTACIYWKVWVYWFLL